MDWISAIIGYTTSLIVAYWLSHFFGLDFIKVVAFTALFQAHLAYSRTLP